MEKKLLSLMVCLLMSCGIFATGIDREQAAKLARKFMAENFSLSSKARRAAATIPLNTVETGQSLVYAFNVEGGGYVVVAGDDCAPAVLGYSERSAIDADDMPEGMKALFEQYQQEMQYMIQNGRRAEAIATLGDEIGHLMTCKWGQGAPYNYMCPKGKSKRDGEIYLSLTGCPATAMAQVMFYHQYPAEIKEIPGPYYNGKLSGRSKIQARPMIFNKTLDWGNMLSTYGTRKKVGGTQEQQDAVAKLMRLVGQSICMQYSPDASGSVDEGIYSSLVNFFNYDASTVQLVFRTNYTYSEWVKIMYEEIKAKRPIVYGGGSMDSGHSFVVDGYYKEDFFYINWGWYGNSDGAYRLALCDPPMKYEGGGSGETGYGSGQSAIIGIQKPKTDGPQQVDPMIARGIKWIGAETYERSSKDQDFDLTKAIRQLVYSRFDKDLTFSYGAIVRKEDGTAVQQMLPLNDNTAEQTLKSGRSILFNKEPLKVGAGLGDGNYTLEFAYKYPEGEWHSFSKKIKFKIKDNTLTFNGCPDWLNVSLEATKLGFTGDVSYAVKVKLENNSTDKEYARTLKIGRDNSYKQVDDYGFTVLLGPGEKIDQTVYYEPKNYSPKNLYLIALEDGVPIAKTTVIEKESIVGKIPESEFNVSAELKETADKKSYVLKTDDDRYEVVCKLTNTSKDDFSGYLLLVDSIKDKTDGFGFEENDSKGANIKLKAGETQELRLFIENDGNPDIQHKLSLASFDEYDLPETVNKTEEFTIRPNYDLQFTDFDVTPKEKADDDYAEYIVKGNQLTVSGKISNPEEKAFEGAIMISRYTIDLSDDPEIDEDGNNVIDCDQVYLDDISIPANGTVDYSKAFDLEGLVKNKDYSVFVEFEISYMPKLSGYAIPLYYSDAYLLNDGTPTGISITRVERQQQTEGIYDLQGRRISGKPVKGVYIINGKKYILK